MKTTDGIDKDGNIVHFKSAEERFWSKVDIKDKDSCWEWISSVSSPGYGQFNYKGVHISSHRLSWILTNGEIPKDKNVLHKCDNRRCVNPDHLYLGTQSNNICDAITRGRGCFGKHKIDR
jgi:hypothetical protein